MELADEDILEIERCAVGLELDLARRVDRFVPLPIVFHDDVSGDKGAVEMYGHPLGRHPDVKSVPFSDGVVSRQERLCRARPRGC